MNKSEMWKDVQERYKSVVFPEPSLEPMWYGRREKTVVPGRRVIVDNRSGDALGVCTDQYQLVRYEDVILMTEEIVKKIGLPKVEICPQIFGNGGRMSVKLKMTGSSYEVAKGDNIIPKIDITTSYDLSWVMQILFGMFRLVCSNGAGTWIGFEKFRKRHIQSLDLNLSAEMISDGLLIFKDQVEVWKTWKNIMIPEADYDPLWKDLPFSAAEKEKIEAVPDMSTHLRIPDLRRDNRLDLWSLNNVLTQYSSHQIKSEIRRHEIQPQIARSMDLLHRRLAA